LPKFAFKNKNILIPIEIKNKIVTHFYVKAIKIDSNGEAPIFLRITVIGVRAEISANRRVSTDLWDKSAKRVVGR
jgi:hypothetical protein